MAETEPIIETIMRRIRKLEGDRENIGIRSQQYKPIECQHEDCVRQRNEIRTLIEAAIVAETAKGEASE